MASKYSIRHLRSLFIRIAGFFGGVKKTQINAFATNGQMGLPFLSRIVPRYSLVSRFIILRFCSVHAILLMRNFAQIFNSVISTVTINMVNFAKRPLIMFHGPNNSVCWNNNFVYTYFNISKAICPRNLSFFSPLRGIIPNQMARLWVIRQFFVQNIYRNFSHTHDIQLFLNGVKYGIS